MLVTRTMDAFRTLVYSFSFRRAPDLLLLRSPSAGHRRWWYVLVLQFFAVLGIDRFRTAEHCLERDVVPLGDLVHEKILARQIVRHERGVLVESRQFFDRLARSQREVVGIGRQAEDLG